jgi:manganese/zinc/iron transport system permease protein
MELLRLAIDFFSDYTIRIIVIGTAILGFVSGSLGSYAVLRKQSLLGDAISHATLPGIALAFLLTRSKAPFVLIIGAMIAGWLGTLFIMTIVKNTRIKSEGALGLILSVFFGFGLVLLSFIQKIPDSTQAGLDKYLFGQSAALLRGDIVIMSIFGVISLVTVFILWKEFKLICFDPGFGASIGFPSQLLETILTGSIVIAIVIGLKTVGVILMSALIIAPAAAARQWTDRLSVMVLLSGLFGALSGVAGALISTLVRKLPTGPVIVLCLTAMVAVSLLFAPKRGIIWNAIRVLQSRLNIQKDQILTKLYHLAKQHKDFDHKHAVTVIKTMTDKTVGVTNTLSVLERDGFVKQCSADEWCLTDKGFAYAKQIESKGMED